MARDASLAHDNSEFADRLGMKRTWFVLFLMLAFASCGGGSDLNVLFIGNSYTHGNDLPGVVEEIADANGVLIGTEMIAPGGAYLHEHVTNPEVIEAIQSGNFDVVVFQEQSVAPSVLAFAEQNTLPAARSLDSLADAAGLQVVWFQTWGHVAGFPSEGHDTYESMQAAVNRTYETIVAENGGSVARVGETWSRARDSVPTALYHQDGTHPSPAGTYLAAIEIAEAIIGPLSEAPSVGEIDEETAQALANA